MKYVAIVFLIGLMPLAAPAGAQPPSTGSPDADDAIVAERVELMEQALEQAVSRGIRIVERQLPALAPGLVFFVGPIQARGFVLDGYGVFFDVEYPVVRRSILWSMGMLRQFDVTMSDTLEGLRRRMQGMQEGPARAAFGQALREIEAAVGPTAPVAPVALGGPRTSTDRRDVETAPPSGAVSIDPQELYLSALTGSLTDALLAYGEAMPVDGDAWLTVAARDGRGSYGRGRAPARRTLRLRIRGRDLAAIRNGELSPEEARARVEIP
ncbi:MAG: hypothetical protein V3T48_08405 [Vicinamibacterales bacterium]